MNFLLCLYAILLLIIAGKYARQTFEASFDQNYYPTYGRVIHQGNEVLLLLDHTSGLIHYSLYVSLGFALGLPVRWIDSIHKTKANTGSTILSVKYKRFSPSCAMIAEL